MNRAKKIKNHGFSFIEILIALGLSSIIGLFAYRTLTHQVATQVAQIGATQIDNQVLQSSQSLKEDISQIDFQWISRGIVPVAKGTKADGTEWITLLVPHTAFTKLIQFTSDVSDLYDQSAFLPVRPVVTNGKIQAGDYVLIHRTRNYVVAKISSRSTFGLGVFETLTGLKFEALSTNDVATAIKPGVTERFPDPSEDFTSTDTVIQKVIPITYQIKTRLMGVNKTPTPFLTRTTNGLETTLAPMEHLNFSFDQLATDGTLEKERSTIDLAKSLLSITATLLAGGPGKDKRITLKQDLPGSASGQRYSEGKVSVSTTGAIATIDVGQPAFKQYNDGSKRLVVPRIDFGDSLPMSRGSILIIDGNTGQPMGAPIELNWDTGPGGSVPFLPATATITSEGVVFGGYAEVSGERKAAMGFYPLTNGKIEPGAKVEIFGVVGGENFTTTFEDTASVAYVDGKVFVAPYTKRNMSDDLVIHRLDMQSGGSLSTAENVFTESGPSTTNVLVTALSSLELNGQKYLCACFSNSSIGGNDGNIRIAQIQSDGSLDTFKKVANHDFECKGLSSTPSGDLLVAGKLTVKPIPSGALSDIVNNSASPVTLNLDDKNSGTGKYYDGYNVSDIVTGSPPQVINNLQGVWVNPLNDMSVQVVVTNKGANSKDASITTIQGKGTPPRVLATIASLVPNLNASEVHVAKTSGFLETNLSAIPPGAYQPNPTRSTPTQICTRNLPSDLAGWFDCIRQRQGSRSGSDGDDDPVISE